MFFSVCLKWANRSCTNQCKYKIFPILAWCTGSQWFIWTRWHFTWVHSWCWWHIRQHCVTRCKGYLSVKCSYCSGCNNKDSTCIFTQFRGVTSKVTAATWQSLCYPFFYSMQKMICVIPTYLLWTTLCLEYLDQVEVMPEQLKLNIYDTMVQFSQRTELISSLTQAFTLSSTRASSSIWENINTYNRLCCQKILIFIILLCKLIWFNRVKACVR